MNTRFQLSHGAGRTFSQMSVNLENSMLGGRAIWGFPKTMESLEWHRNENRVTFRRQTQLFRVRAFGPAFPIALPFWTAQQKDGIWNRVPGHIEGSARLAFRGPQGALFLESFSMTIEPPQ